MNKRTSVKYRWGQLAGFRKEFYRAIEGVNTVHYSIVCAGQGQYPTTKNIQAISLTGATKSR